MLDNRREILARQREGCIGSAWRQQADMVAFRGDKEGQILYAWGGKSAFASLSQPNLLMDKVQKVVQTL